MTLTLASHPSNNPASSLQHSPEAEPNHTETSEPKLNPSEAPADLDFEAGAVFVIEDDPLTRDALAALFSPTKSVHAFGSAEEFLRQRPTIRPACLLIDERLPGMNGSELLRRLEEQALQLPAVVVTGFADTPSTVEAMQHGALTVLDKPCGDHALQQAVAAAIERDREQVELNSKREAAINALDQLSANEREVLTMVLDGVPNKQIARRMNVCVRTIESRRSKIYRATNVNSVAGLVRLCVLAGFVDG